MIPVDKFIKLHDQYNRRIMTLESIIQNENQNLERINTISQENFTLKQSLYDVKAEKEKLDINLNDLNNVFVLNGYWTNTFKEQNDQDPRKEKIFIDKGKYFITQDLGGMIHAFDIIDFFYNRQSSKIHFVKVSTADNVYLKSKTYLVNNLEIQEDGILRGDENYDTKIEYKKIQNS